MLLQRPYVPLGRKDTSTTSSYCLLEKQPVKDRRVFFPSAQSKSQINACWYIKAIVLRIMNAPLKPDRVLKIEISNDGRSHEHIQDL